MHATIYVKLDPNFGIDSGPFDVYTNLDLVLPILTDIPRSEFIFGQGLELAEIDDSATSIILISKGGCCNTTSIPIVDVTTTTTSTTTAVPTTTSTTTAAPTTTSTTTAAPGPTTTSTTSTTTTNNLPTTTSTTTTTTTGETTTTTSTTTSTTTEEPTTTTSTTTTTTTLQGILANFRVLAYADNTNGGSCFAQDVRITTGSTTIVGDAQASAGGIPGGVVEMYIPTYPNWTTYTVKSGDVIQFYGQNSGNTVYYTYQKTKNASVTVLDSGTNAGLFSYTIIDADTGSGALYFEGNVSAET